MSSRSQELLVDAPLLSYWSRAKAIDLLVQLSINGITTTDLVYEISDTTGQHKNQIAQDRSYYQPRCSDPKLNERTRRIAIDATVQIDRIADTCINGHLRIVELDDAESNLFCQLTSDKQVEKLGLTWKLGDAAASCAAVAVNRGLGLASDDADACAALKRLSPGHPTQSTQDLLRTAVEARLISKEEVNAIHGEMCEVGLWNRQPPYPNI